MPSYLSPGVYVEEVAAGVRPIEGVGTAVAAFVGFAETARSTSRRWSPTGTSTPQRFGGFTEGAYLAALGLRLLRQRRRRRVRRPRRRPGQDASAASADGGRARRPAGGAGGRRRLRSSRPLPRRHRGVTSRSPTRTARTRRGPLQAARPPGRRGRGDVRRLHQARTSRTTWSTQVKTLQADPVHRAAGRRRRPAPTPRRSRCPTPAAAPAAAGPGEVARLGPAEYLGDAAAPHRLRRPGEPSTRSPWSPCPT